MMEELHMLPPREQPLATAASALMSYCMLGCTPLVPGVVSIAMNGPDHSSMHINAALVICVLVLFALGSCKSLISVRRWYVAGLQLLLVACLSMSVAWILTHSLRAMLPIQLRI